MRLFIIGVIYLLPQFLFGQSTDSVWCFGHGARINFKNSTAIDSSSVLCRGSCVSICDSNGQLNFYAETMYLNFWQTGIDSLTAVFNKHDTIMQNGTFIIGQGWYKELTIIPVPNSSNLYYLLTAPVTGKIGMAYSIIDMTLDSGLGAVVQKNIELLDSTYAVNDGITAIKHGNGRDWWLICRHWELPANNEFMFFLITPDSIYLHHTQNIGVVDRLGFYRIEPSLDGTLISACDPNGLIVVYNFDRCNGNLSNENIISTLAGSASLAPFYWDCELSPSKRYLYVSQAYSPFDTTNYLLRFDLQAANIAASRDTLFAVEQSAVAGLIELAPDGKIYWSCAYNPPNIWFYPYPDSTHNYITDNLSVINDPDSVNCNFQPFSFYLGGKRTYYGLPNNPNYELGPLLGSPCDTLSAATPKPPTGGLNTGVLQCTYISNWNKLFINARGVKSKDVTVSIYDATGSLKFEVKSLKNNAGYVTVDVDCGAAGSPSGAGGAGWSNGIYIVNLLSEKESLSCKFVKQ